MRHELTGDAGGAESASAAKLLVIDSAVYEKVWLARIDRAIEAFLKKHPAMLDNPKGLALLYSYRERPLNAFLKAIGMVGFARVGNPEKSLSQLFEGD